MGEIQLTPEIVFCPFHLEPFRAEWPRGFPVAMVLLFQAAMRKQPPLGGGESTEAAAQAVVDEVHPLCCFVDPDELALTYAEAGVDPDPGAGR